MCLRYNEINGLIKNQNRIKYLVLFGYGWFDKICDRIKYFMSEKNDVTDSTNHNFAEIRTDSYNSLPIEKILTFHNVIILIKSVVNKNIFLEEGLHKDKFNTEYF